MAKTTAHGGPVIALATGLLLLGLGCSDEESSKPGSTTTGAGGTGAGGVGGQGPTVTVNLAVIGLDGARIEDVEVCEDGASPANCQTSDSNGVVGLDLPADSELVIRMQKAGLVTRITPFETVPNVHLMFFHAMVTEAEAVASAQAYGVTLDDTKGFLAFTMISQADPGIAASLSPASGDGPCYWDSSFTPMPQATTIPPGGGATFFNVDPGTVTVGFTPATAGCAFFDEAWGADADATPVLVEANTHTGMMDLECP